MRVAPSSIPIAANQVGAAPTPAASLRARAPALNNELGELTPSPSSSHETPAVATFDDTASSSRETTRASQLAAEARALREARASLRAGQLSTAFATLEASRQTIFVPELFQEREALMIELLFRSGQVDAAALRAKAFLARFPESPHAAQIQRFATPR
jgi:hypothetical protein